MCKNFWALGVFIALFLGACSHTKVQVIPKDLSTYPQNANYYLEQTSLNFTLPTLNPKELKKLKNDYLSKFFSPWSEEPNEDVDSVFWVRYGMLQNKGYGENTKPYTLQEAQSILDSMQLESYPSAKIKAIITKTTSVRAVPTIMPKFSKKDGYPFDRWQNSLIFAGTPVLITHFDTSARFAHIQSSFVYGWVELSDIGFVGAKDSATIQKFSDYITPNRDNITIKDIKGNFYTTARLGQVFALNPNFKNAQEYEIYIYTRTESATAKITTARVSKQDFIPFPNTLDSSLVADFLTQLMGKKYGWGGMYEERDCSALVRDIFAHNGIFLPRNSKAQALYASNAIDLSKMSAKKKEKFIIENATPFYTILWLQGHIMIYLGAIEGRAIVAHSAWSVTSGKKYENLLGGVVVSSLYVGDEKNGIFSRSKTLLERVGAMSDMRVLSEKILQSK